MMVHIQAFALLAFAAVMAIAAFEDLRRLVIPNLLPIALCVLWPAYFLAAPSLSGAMAAVGCALAVFVAGAVLFARGLLGGGDVKLLAAASLWAGPAGTPDLLMLTAAFGGALALLLLLPAGGRAAAAIRRRLGHAPAEPQHGLAAPIPYGVAIAGAALLVTLPHHIG